jgi:hypothetical protein
MTDNLYSPDFEALERFKRSAERSSPEPIDFSEKVILRIQSESALNAPAMSQRRKRTAIAIASIALAVALLSGFTYAATTRWLSIQDKSGREVMLISRTDDTTYDPELAERYGRILDKVRSQLQAGEAAHILIGQEEIDAMNKWYAPKSWSIAMKGFTYSSTKALSAHLVGSMSQVKLLGDNIGDAKLAQVERMPNIGSPPIQPDQWVEATDAESGEPYVYHKVTNIEQVNSVYDTVQFTYRDKKATYKLHVSSTEMRTAELFDPSPSAERIHEVAGVPVYSYERDGERAPHLVWSQQVNGVSLLYFLDSPTANTKKQLAFAKSVIEATASDRK